MRVTLGPKSKSVLIEKKWGKPLVCNDGVTIAKEVSFADHEENLGAQMMREAAERTGETVGDGTSTATVLAHAIFADGVRNVARARARRPQTRPRPRDGGRGHPRDFTPRTEPPREGAGGDDLGAQRHGHRRDGRGRDGEGRAEGAISVEEAKTTETALEVVEGMQFDRGYISPYFITNAEKMEAVLEEPLILLYERGSRGWTTCSRCSNRSQNRPSRC